MNSKQQQQEEKWLMYNEISRKMEEVDIETCELVAGQYVTCAFWSGSLEKFVTIPGASGYKVNAVGQLVLDIE